MKTKKELIINAQRCKSCGLCVAACPKATLSIGATLNHHGYAFVEQTQPENCVKCNICRIVCPDVAIGAVEMDA